MLTGVFALGIVEGVEGLVFFIRQCMPPSSSGLGHLPFTEAAGIRIPLGVFFVFWTGLDMTERITENLVRDFLREHSYYSDGNGVTVEEQKSEIATVKIALSKASKHKTGKTGYPEFIISNKMDASFIIVFECKADVKKHESCNRDKPIEYGIDGVLHYAKHLSKNYTVIAVAVSGKTKSSLKISNFIFPCGGTTYKELTNESGKSVDEILPFDDYYRLASFDPEVARKRHSDLLAFSRELHELIWTKAKVSEEEKPLLVSGTLIALMNNAFQKTFKALSSEEVQDAWINAIKRELDKAEIPQGKKDTMIQPYTTIAVHPNLAKPDSKLSKEYPDGVFKEIINRINDNVWPFISIYHDFDVVGQFYGEFLKYTAGDKKALGIVLTPRHVAELFSLITNVTKEDKVVDICAGTGGFLISAMQHMLRTALTDAERSDIKKNRLIGIENSPKMFALAASNMILRGDGKANLHQGSCFDEAIVQSIKASKPTVGMLNPPYAQSKSDAELHELYFVKHMLDMLTKGATGIAIIPVSCVIAPSPAKAELLKSHTLKAVMSMPSELFYPVATVTCIVVFEAHMPHKTTNKKTWFGYWRDDGFIKTKHLGRIDQKEVWASIRDKWVESYRNSEVHAGQSVMAYVTEQDEWIAEAYLETDYSKITKADFEETLTNHTVFKLLNEQTTTDITQYSLQKTYNLVPLSNVFCVTYGTKFDLNKMTYENPTIHFVGRSGSNNGVTSCVDIFQKTQPLDPGLITVALGGSVLASFVQIKPFYTGQNVAVLSPLFEMSTQIKLLYCKIIHANAFRFSTCGREANRTLKQLLVPSLEDMKYWADELTLSSVVL